MFAHLDLTGLPQSKLFNYAKDVPYFQGRSQVTFQPGLNILVGPNGCGKSTVLNILGQALCATQGGVSTVTETSVHDGVDMMAGIKRSLGAVDRGMTDHLGLHVAHDGQPAVYCDPRATVGLTRGAFDDDFFRQGMLEISERGSHGQHALRRAGGVLAILREEAPFPTAIHWQLNLDRVNDVWKEALDVLARRFEPAIPTGQPTILLDEPEANFSLVWQARLWQLLAQPRVAERFQVIVATHSAFALGIAHAHYLDLQDGFRTEAEQVLRERFAGAAT